MKTVYNTCIKPGCSFYRSPQRRYCLIHVELYEQEAEAQGGAEVVDFLMLQLKASVAK